MLERELKIYQEVRSTLPRGQFVLIHGSEMVGVYPTENQALSEGARRFGREPYLVKQVLDQEPIVSNLALSLGILRAVPASPTSR